MTAGIGASVALPWGKLRPLTAKAKQTVREYRVPLGRAMSEPWRGGPRGIVVPGARAGNNAYHLAALLFFSLPLLAEVFRKYVFPWNGVLVASDVLAALIAAVLFVLRPSRRSVYITVAVGALSAWGVVTVLFGHQDRMLGLVGLRAILVPAFYLIGAVQLARRLGGSATAGVIYRVATFWLVVIGAVATLQLLVGRRHWLNYLPPELGADERQGIGDYTFAEFGLPELFRPTSIFLHTGKFGAVAFVLAAFRLFYSTASGQKGAHWVAGRLLELAILLLSGQRAAVVGFVFLSAGLWLAQAKKSNALVLRALLACVVVVAATWGILRQDWEPGVLQLVALRAYSGFLDIPERFRSNVLEPAGYVADRFGLTGEGIGAFSLGSGPWGGVPLYEVVPVGSAENSWLRIIAEQGMIGLVLQASFWVGLVWASWTAWRRSTEGWPGRGSGGNEPRLVLLCPGMILAVLLLWANTHDVLGNVTVMSLALALFGVPFSEMGHARAHRSAALSRGRSG